MRFQNGQMVNRLQGRSAQVVDIAAYRARMFVSDQQIVKRFMAGAGVQSISRQTKKTHDEIQRALRAEIGGGKRAA